MGKRKEPGRSSTRGEAGIPKNVETYAINVLRRHGWAKWVPRWNVLKAARKSRGKYECNICKNLFGPKEVAVDHIEPVVAITGWVNFDTYILRLLVSEKDLQVLCSSCHTEKTVNENAQRKR